MLGIRWTIGDVNPRGFEALRLSIWGTWSLFGAFAPLQCFPDRRELALDNDVILWDMPEALAAWLADSSPESCLLAEDVTSSLGQFGSMCGARALNTGIRGLPAGFDLEERLRAVLDVHPVTLVSELDEQGLQVAALSWTRPPHVVSVHDVTICSPFPPHLPHRAMRRTLRRLEREALRPGLLRRAGRGCARTPLGAVSHRALSTGGARAGSCMKTRDR